MPPDSLPQSSFPCRFPGCNATYRRKEHLNRHMTRHDQRQRFSCPHCNSTLVRSDLLRRHIRKHHPEREPVPSRAQKACRACHARKERCDGEDPCIRCLRRQVTCFYPRQESIRGERKGQEPQITDLLMPEAPDTSRWVAQGVIEIYFRGFHPIWPFLHPGTFEISKEPCILLQSMVMVGLWVKGEPATRDMAMTFHRKLLSEIQGQRSKWYISESESMPSDTPWPMPTYQSILLQLIFALLVAKQETTFDLNLRCDLPASVYELLTSLVQTCRRRGLFSYPNMLTQHDASAPIALLWLTVEETKRFGLALYKLCRLCRRRSGGGGGGGGGDDPAPAGTATTTGGSQTNDLLTLADLDFCLPDGDEVWNALSVAGADLVRSTAALQETTRDNRDPEGWISHASGQLCDERVGFDWV